MKRELNVSKFLIKEIIDFHKDYDPYDFEEDMIDDVISLLHNNPEEILQWIEDEVLSCPEENPAELVNRGKKVHQMLLQLVG